MSPAPRFDGRAGLEARISPRGRLVVALASAGLSACSLAIPLDDYDRGSTATSGTGGAGGTCAPGSHPRISSLVDDFSDGTPAPAWVPVGRCSPLETRGEVVVVPPTTGDEFCWYASVDTFQLRCDAVTFLVAEATAPALGVQTFVYIDPTDAAEPINLILEGGGFQLGKTSDMTSLGKAYDSVDDRWWRLREAADRLHFETSPDGKVWADLGSIPDPEPLDAVRIRFGAGTYMPLANPGQARFDCYNVPPPCP